MDLGDDSDWEIEKKLELETKEAKCSGLSMKIESRL